MSIRISVGSSGISRRSMGGAIGRLRKRLKRAKTDEERATIEALIDEASEVRKVKGERSRAVRSADRKWSITTKALARIRKVTKKTEDPECRVKLEKLEKKAVGRLRDMQPPRVSPMKASASSDASRNYQSGLAQRRLEVLKGQPREVIAAQPEAYKELGVDTRAGFDGKPPAFIPDSKSRSRWRNAARDPMRKMFVAGHIEKHQYDAANEIQSLQERYDKAGMRTNGIPELIDGGKAPDVSEEVMSAVAKFRSYEKGVSERARMLLRLIVIDGLSIASVAQMGHFGRNQGRLGKKLRESLDEAAIFFGLLALPEPEEEAADVSAN